MTYRKTQSGGFILLPLGLALIGTIAVALWVDSLGWILAFLLLVVGVLFSSMTITIEAGELSFFFGPGFWKKRIAVARIAEARPVRNKWWYGWGIRYTPHGWLYNISGLDALELHLIDGKILRLGTSEPEVLAQAITEARKA
jgi:hypothetical protein